MAVKFAKQELSLLAANAILPNDSVSNEQLLEALGQHVSSKYVRQAKVMLKRLGIEQRHLSRRLDARRSQASPTGVDMAQQLISEALAKANLATSQLDYLVTHTTTPHTQVPPNAAWLADTLNYHGPYMELRQACCGFANALQVASGLCANGDQHIAIVGSETGSVYFDIDESFIDRGQLVNYVQMGDGAGGVIVAPCNGERAKISDIYLGQIGVGKSPGFYLDGGANSVGDGQMARFDHDFSAVRTHGPKLFEHGLAAITARGYCLDDFRYILPHQANGHIDSLLAKELGISPSRIINHAKRFGNLGSAAIWVSFATALAELPLEAGDKVLILGAEATKYLYGGFVYTH
ncbi:3-oxoacyl-ACP synthase III family protein [Paraferrimonas haliotis]|uniref:3-oxoacyl-[acyl-carrier-protein] synthase 3 n=1 Tax=Paraferrimonas haliotis TaxID=2013866 RepID=A0AA37WXX6_9GAMM|nr:3-oxoacyl-[acyl-carrier-protein] synthase III C-terminal domain-containing protein [Paraferrimonas haliotis]GLS84034.1 3-oxoacyl-[acyl-carrier-protein] synthase 3 [Paraferrimonas haliotis]